MRSLRPSLAAVLVLALLGGLGGAVVAQEDDAEQGSLGLSPVTGTITFGRLYDYETSFDEDRSRWQYGLVKDVLEMDDPRLRGTVWSTWNEERLPDPSGLVFGQGGSLAVGNAEIVNDDGSWRGTLHGQRDPATMDWLLEYDLAGTGSYEGYTALLYVTGQGGRMDVDGFVFPGNWPDYPDAVQVPAD